MNTRLEAIRYRRFEVRLIDIGNFAPLVGTRVSCRGTLLDLTGAVGDLRNSKDLAEAWLPAKEAS